MQYADISTATLLKELKSSKKGLSSKEAKKRLKRFGKNEIKTEKGPTWISILLAQFFNIMVLILAIAMAISISVGEWVESIAIGVVIILNAIVGFIQEYRAEQAIEALKKMTAPVALVIRDGEQRKIDAKELVPGDLIILEEGSAIPADARILSSMQLSVMEAALTGESQAIAKSEGVIKSAKSLGDQSNMLFMGTTIAMGHGTAMVTETGMQTQFGQIAHMVQTEKSGPTPLQKQLDKLIKQLALIIFGITAILFTVSLLRGEDLIDVLLLSITLVVSAIPEGLPAVITLTLALSVQKMAKRNAIIRKLSAAETLGSTNVICSDKTGTLTQNQMTVQHLYVNGRIHDVSGIGYEPEGTIQDFDKKNKELNQLLSIALHCNNANLFKDKKKWSISGDPTEACLITLAQKAGLNKEAFEKKYPRLNELVFDSKRKRMSTRDKSSMYSKGAPDEILAVCTHIQMDGKEKKLTPALRKQIEKQNKAFASQAFRVLGMAIKNLETDADFEESGMTFIGLVAMMDPPREEVKKAIQTCREANISVVMITGDHALTAMAIGKEIGLYKEGEMVLTGAELEAMTDKQLEKKVTSIRIYARVNPSHKVRILKAFKKHGNIVAMTGDGVNDAPALKSADIGVAMGITGTDVAQEASKMILTDDNFATIVSSVESGRAIYRNIKKFIRYLLGANFGEVLIITLITVLGFPKPILPLQILWINLLTDAFPALALGADLPDDDIMKLKPRMGSQSIWKDLIRFSMVAGVTFSILSMVIYFTSLQSSGDIAHTRTMVFTMLVCFQMCMVFSTRYEHESIVKNFFKNPMLLMAVMLSISLQLLAIYTPFLQEVLETRPLGLKDWAWIVGACLVGILLIEGWKKTRPKPSHV